MRHLPQFFVVSLIIFSLLLVPSLVFAQSDPNCSDPSKPTSLACIPVFIGNIADSAMILGGVAAVFFVAFAGIKFLTSGGDPTRLESAKKTLTFAVIGLLIILLSFTIIKVVAKVTNTNCKVLGIWGCK